jgi:hypothetical protein
MLPTSFETPRRLRRPRWGHCVLAGYRLFRMVLAIYGFIAAPCWPAR